MLHEQTGFSSLEEVPIGPMRETGRAAKPRSLCQSTGVGVLIVIDTTSLFSQLRALVDGNVVVGNDKRKDNGAKRVDKHGQIGIGNHGLRENLSKKPASQSA